jgi:hypothetical protein
VAHREGELVEHPPGRSDQTARARPRRRGARQRRWPREGPAWCLLGRGASPVASHLWRTLRPSPCPTIPTACAARRGGTGPPRHRQGRVPRCARRWRAPRAADGAHADRLPPGEGARTRSEEPAGVARDDRRVEARRRGDGRALHVDRRGDPRARHGGAVGTRVSVAVSSAASRSRVRAKFLPTPDRPGTMRWNGSGERLPALWLGRNARHERRSGAQCRRRTLV